MKNVILIGLLICSMLPLNGHTQTQVAIGGENLEILKILEMYKNAPNLSFNFTLTYSDSANVDSVVDTGAGYCKMSDGRYYTYTYDSTEYVQGYQYNLVVSHNDSSIVVNDRQDYGVLTKGILLFDSLFVSQYIDSLKVLSYDDLPTNDLIVFFNSASPYSKYILTYDHNSYRVTTIVLYLRDPDAGTTKVQYTLTSYSTDPISQDLFWEDKFIYNQSGTLHLKPAYTGYQLLDYRTLTNPAQPQ